MNQEKSNYDDRISYQALFDTFKRFHDNDDKYFSETKLTKKGMMESTTKLEEMLFLSSKDKYKISSKFPFIRKTLSYKLNESGKEFFSEIEQYARLNNNPQALTEIITYFRLSLLEKRKRDEAKQKESGNMSIEYDIDSPDILMLKERLKNIEEKRRNK